MSRPGWDRRDCEHCAGHGELQGFVSRGEGDFYVEEWPCPVCKGDGYELVPNGLEVVFMVLDLKERD